MLVIKPTKLGTVINLERCRSLARLPHLFTGFGVETRHVVRTLGIHTALALIFARGAGVDNARAAEETALVTAWCVGVTCLIGGTIRAKAGWTGLKALLGGIHEGCTAVHFIGGIVSRRRTGGGIGAGLAHILAAGGGITLEIVGTLTR